MQETRLQSLGREDPQEKKWQPTPVSLPGKSHGQRGLVGCSPWGHKELDMTYRLSNNNKTLNENNPENLMLKKVTKTKQEI